tara:strand:+ start:745 stop:951 length:207 start_codon:yes stop_codon:yes gene_type:complete
MNTLTVLDFETGKVYQYEVMRQEGWNPDQESIEDFLNSVGHNLKNCEWMVHDGSEVVNRKAKWKRFTY